MCTRRSSTSRANTLKLLPDKMKFKIECPKTDESVFVVFIVQSTENASGKTADHAH